MPKVILAADYDSSCQEHCIQLLRILTVGLYHAGIKPHIICLVVTS